MVTVDIVNRVFPEYFLNESRGIADEDNSFFVNEHDDGFGHGVGSSLC